METDSLARSFNGKITEFLRHAGIPEIIIGQVDTIIYIAVILIIAFVAGKVTMFISVL